VGEFSHPILIMIDWDKTIIEFGIDRPVYRSKYCVICDECKTTGVKVLTRVADIVDGQLLWKCPKCWAKYKKKDTYSSESFKNMIRERSMKLWCDGNYRKRVLESKALSYDPQKASSAAKKCWERPEYREKVSIGLKKVSHVLSAGTKKQWEDPIYRNHMVGIFSDRSVRLWEDPEYRSKVSKSLRECEKLHINSKRIWDSGHGEHLRQLHIRLWHDLEYRKRMTELVQIRGDDPKFQEVCRQAAIKAWTNQEIRDNYYRAIRDPEYLKRQSEASKKLWQNKEYRDKILSVLADARQNMPRVSNLQKTLYSILDDLGVKYYREFDDHIDKECIIGPYTFDCVIPRENKPSILIECQGEYWHSLDRSVRNDKCKSSYVYNNFPGKYELKYIWEHEFACKDKVVGVIQYWLGLTDNGIIDFNFSNLEIKSCPASDYRQLLSKYHYLSTAGLGGIAYGAYLNNELAAVCIFSPLGRQNKEKSIGANKNQVRELSRLCIHPKYQKKNFASWFVSRCIKKLDQKYSIIVSYCDTTFNHDGAIYKACNFIQDKKVRPDYWYVSTDGWVMHKKTLYNRAVMMKMKEKQYAENLGYKKVFGFEKLRFIFKR
jgi:GNAT superfamily N-acetyltransferase